MKKAKITIPSEKLADFCRKNCIRKLAFFGSVLREDFRTESDIDVLVEFEPGHVPGLAFFDMEKELAEILGHKVELHTPGFLSPYFREQVIKEAEVQYAAS
ncbi:MAG: nucleotidyltransferase family protein [Deltaproteobacteria bacterium]|nr:nucleotidyltransferase family protein [Deltaproteobacteria bacterium]